MPIPKPEPDEDEDDFISRCMTDDTMTDEYPDSEQRLKVCYSQMDGKMIKRDISFDECEIKLDKGTFSFEGYASVFGGVDSYKDTIVNGAYSETIKKNKKLPMFINHDSYSIPVGDWVTMKEDDKGLFVLGKIDKNHNDGPPLYSALERGAMTGLSIGFRIPAGGAIEREDGVRELIKIDLKEISVVNYPADDAARIAVVKSDIESIKTLKDAERLLRDSGYSKQSALAFVSRIKQLSLSDSGKLRDEIAENTDRLINFINKMRTQ